MIISNISNKKNLLVLAFISIAFTGTELFFIIYVVSTLPKFNSLGLIRYHAQRALTCYALLMDSKTSHVDGELFRLAIGEDGSSCFGESKAYVQNYDSYYGLFGQFGKMSQMREDLSNTISKYLPDFSSLKNETLNDAQKFQEFISQQSTMKMNIIELISTLINEESKIMKWIYIFNYMILFAFAFSTMAYSYVSYVNKWKQQESKVQSCVLNQLCHELRTTLTPIEMYSRELMLSKDLDFEKKQFINNYIISSLKTHRYVLVRRLDFEKIISKKCKYKLNLENIDLINYIESHITETNQYINLCDKDIRIEFNVNSDVKSLFIQTDKMILYHILSNVLRNSVKYSNEGVILLKLNINNESNEILLSIKDEGNGLSFKELNKLNDIDRSSKNNTITSSSRDSYGLGIKFIKRLISFLQDGQYTIESEGINKGSLTNIYFKYTKADPEFIALRTIDKNNFNIMIVDDCPIVRAVMERTLKNIFSDVCIHKFINAEALLKFSFEEDMYYFHILDQNMHSTGGRLLGHEVAFELKHKCFNGNHFTISMSGSAMSNEESDMFDIIWNKPPPSNDEIREQFYELIKNKSGRESSSTKTL